MNIGVFDSGIGGLVILKAIIQRLPNYSYVFLGDTKHIPYGPKTEKEIERLTKQNIDYLFKKQNCALVIVACNTASAKAVRALQEKYPYQKILGVIIPTIEEIKKGERVGVFATTRTVASGKYIKELRKRFQGMDIVQKSAPLLVPMIEAGKYDKQIVQKYISYFIEKKVTTIILGCTHYSLLKKEIRKIIPKNIRIISQDEIIPKKLGWYLPRHKEIADKLSKTKRVQLLVTKHTPTIQHLAYTWFHKTNIEEIIM